jgi:monoamine oxidase
MLDVAIVGGGLCGLALAHSLQARRVDWALFEARPRLGGRVMTAHSRAGLPVDLGATWFWPATQPSIARLVDELGLATQAQPDDGQVLLLDDPNRQPARRTVDPASGALAPDGTPPTAGALHAGAHRLQGGMGALVDAFVRRLPPARLHTGQALQGLTLDDGHVRLHLAAGGVCARRVVLALPPRLAAALAFSPALPADLAEALGATPTWMATAAKAGWVVATAPPWRAGGHAGNAWVTHPQAVLAESWDATPEPMADEAGVLAGFLALDAVQRRQFERGLPLLVESQAAMLYGAEAAHGELLLHDWAADGFACAPADRMDADVTGHPSYGHPALQAPQWQGRLWFGGSETARHGGGYLEGALAAAARLRRVLTEAANDAPAPADALQRFGDWARAQREDLLQRYRARVHGALSQQQDDQLTQRAVLGTLEALYEDALKQLRQLPLAGAAEAVQDGRHALTPEVLAPFQGMSDELLDEAARFNRSSCALSNFPFEHRPSAEYLRTIRRDLAAAWQQFAWAANACLLGAMP